MVPLDDRSDIDNLMELTILEARDDHLLSHSFRHLQRIEGIGN